jgi:aminopeptidase C
MLRPGVIAKEKMKDFMLSQAYEQFYQNLDDYAASHTGEMAALMSARLRKAVMEVRQAKFDGPDRSALQEWKMATLKDIYKILVLCLGQPMHPTWNGPGNGTWPTRRTLRRSIFRWRKWWI